MALSFFYYNKKDYDIMRFIDPIQSYSNFHQDLINFITKYYPYNELIDNRKLFTLYCDIITKYNQGCYKDEYDNSWKDEIMKLYNNEQKDKKKKNNITSEI